MGRLDYIKNRRQQLFNQYPYCHWCGIRVKQYAYQDVQRPDTATIDHLIPRNEGFRVDMYGIQKTLVLSCYKCNQERNIKSTNNMHTLQKWLLANAFPKRWYPLKWFLQATKLINKIEVKRN